ncbi:hypothetical protein BKA62DRAFT_802443 [Auriculariales sp. MPI-PUGE-AT-0066]|nr:hypothetical protein BKA62DRAFT_802443 [Auriculariales sp. MPI-PUGE-AT-0066]
MSLSSVCASLLYIGFMSLRSTLDIQRQVIHIGDDKDFWCYGVEFKDAFLAMAECQQSLSYYTGKRTKVTAKSNAKVEGQIRFTGGKAPVPYNASLRYNIAATFGPQVGAEGWCLQKATKTVSGTNAIRRILNLATRGDNRSALQYDRLLTIKKNIVLEKPVINSKGDPRDLLAVLDYMDLTAEETLKVAERIDQEAQHTFNVQSGVQAEWKAILADLALLRKKRMAQFKRYIEGLSDKCATDKDGDVTMGSPGPSKPGQKMQARYRSLLSERSGDLFGRSALPRSSLERRAAAARPPRAGPKAAPCPTCPPKDGKGQKKVIPKSQTKQRPAPVRKPRQPATRPKPRPPTGRKKVTPRPATRPLRPIGKSQPKKRVTPKRMPKKVPRPTQRPKGKPRSRRGRK